MNKYFNIYYKILTLQYSYEFSQYSFHTSIIIIFLEYIKYDINIESKFYDYYY
jgi:hypothetical protein